MASFSWDLIPEPSPNQPLPGTEAVRIGSGLTDKNGAPAGQVENHSARATRRLIKFFQDKPRIQAFLHAFSDEVQELENFTWLYYTDPRDLDTAGGALLDRLGAIVGLPRAGRSDTDYRATVRVEILVLASDGKPDQLYAIAKLLVPAAIVRITENYPAAFQLAFSSFGSFTGSYLLSILRRAKAAGVRMDLGLAGGNIGSVDGDPLGGAIGSTDGDPLGAAIGSVA